MEKQINISSNVSIPEKKNTKKKKKKKKKKINKI